MKASRRAELRLTASTSLSPAACIELVEKAVTEVKPGLNYAGSGLELLLTDADADVAWIEMISNDGAVCDFPVYKERDGEHTAFQVGGLSGYKVTKHTIMFVPVGAEINGYGFYKKFLAAVEQALKTADPGVDVDVAVPAE